MTKLYYFDATVLNDESKYSIGYSLLSEERKVKISKMKVNEPKISSMGAFLLLRHGLRKENIRIEEQHLIYNQNEKPFLENNPLFFNLSHSHGKVMLAISNQEVGCDIELIKDRLFQIAEKFFTTEEVNLLSKAKDKNEAFIHLWTLKEALLKQLGTGLTTPLNQYDFSKELAFDSFQKIIHDKVYCFHSFRKEEEDYLSVASLEEEISSLEEVSFDDLIR